MTVTSKSAESTNSDHWHHLGLPLHWLGPRRSIGAALRPAHWLVLARTNRTNQGYHFASTPTDLSLADKPTWYLLLERRESSAGARRACSESGPAWRAASPSPRPGHVHMAHSSVGLSVRRLGTTARARLGVSLHCESRPRCTRLGRRIEHCNDTCTQTAKWSKKRTTR